MMFVIMILLKTVQKEDIMATKKKAPKKAAKVTTKTASPKVVTRVEYKNHLSGGELTAMILIAIITFTLGFYCGLSWMKDKIADSALNMTMTDSLQREQMAADGSAQAVIDNSLDAAMQVGGANAIINGNGSGSAGAEVLVLE